MAIRRKSALVDEQDKVRHPTWCPFCKGKLELKIVRHQSHDKKRVTLHERYVCEPCGVVVRTGPWPKQPGHVTNGWTRLDD